MMGRAGIAYTTGFMAIATALPYMLGMFIFSGYAGRIQQVGEKYHIESIPSLFEYRFGKPAKCVLAAMVFRHGGHGGRPGHRHRYHY